MNFQQLHVGKVKLNGLAGIQHHLLDRQRVKTNPDIDLTRSHLNHSIEDLSPENLASRVRQRIKQLHLKRKPRSDAVGLMDIIVGASSDFMLKLGSAEREQYFANALYFFQRRFGTDNVMYCHCHLDEHNPHVHIGVIPVTKDGRLSARDLFNPKSLERLQTDFNQQVARLFGLERGKHHARNYLELNQFKLQQTKYELKEFTGELDFALLQQDTLDEIQKSVHFATTGFLFKQEDTEQSELPTKKLSLLQNTAAQGVKANAAVRLLRQQNSQLEHEKALALADSQHYLQLLKSLKKRTELYDNIPPTWKKKIDQKILILQAQFSDYCHDLNRATLRVFLASHGDFERTLSIMHDLLSDIGINNARAYISDVIHDAKFQHKKNIHPTKIPPSWTPPKPSDTDYSKPDELGIVPLQLSRVPDIDWNLINWDLLSELEKEEIKHKIEVFSR